MQSAPGTFDARFVPPCLTPEPAWPAGVAAAASLGAMLAAAGLRV